MKQGGYEAHMTFDKQYGNKINNWLELGLHEFDGMVFSVITGCPLLGPGTYCYLTSYSKNDPVLLIKQMKAVSEFLLNTDNIPTLRTKVEHIVYDTKTGVDETCPLNTPIVNQ